MAFPQGINFRSTAIYVTDVAPDTYDIGAAPGYPTTTPQGNNVGWDGDESYLGKVNVNTSVVKIAGHHKTTDLTQCKDYRFDLPAAGSYEINSGIGDAGYVTDATLEAIDTTTSLGTLSNGNTSVANRWKDAMNTEFTRANWGTSQAPRTLTFATTIARFRLSALNTKLCHLKMTAVAPAAGIFNKSRFARQAVNRSYSY